MRYTPTLIDYASIHNPPEVSINLYPSFDEGVFTVPENDGDKLHAVSRIRQVSCGIADWLCLPSPGDVPADRLWGVYRALMEEGFNKYNMTRSVCYACLRPSLVGLEGKRVEVINDQGDTVRFTVHRSSGWLPVHLAEHKRGGLQLAPSVRFVRVLGHRRK